MTSFQATLAGYSLLAIGAGLAVTVALVKNDTLMGFGIGLIGSGITGLGLPRPQDVQP